MEKLKFFFKRMKALKKYLKKREKAIRLILEKRQQFYTADTFHELRVEIKKLNALFHLVNYSSKEFKARKTYSPFKLIFKQAAKVRELQIEESILKKHFSFTLLKDYRTHLKKLRKKEQECFFTTTNNSFIKRLQKKYRLVYPLLTKTLKKKIIRSMDKKKAKIEKLLHQKNLKTKQVHLLRKRIKEYQYNRKSLDLELRNKAISNKETLAELLGKWHDYQVIIQHLKKVAHSKAINPKEGGQLDTIKATLILKRDKLFNKINATLPILDFFDQENLHKL